MWIKKIVCENARRATKTIPNSIATIFSTIFKSAFHTRQDSNTAAGDRPLPRKVTGRYRVESVSSLMQEAAVRLLDAATVSDASHC
jgi:hypothetical protein